MSSFENLKKRKTFINKEHLDRRPDSIGLHCACFYVSSKFHGIRSLITSYESLVKSQHIITEEKRVIEEN